jgi:hypothetical protein
LLAVRLAYGAWPPFQGDFWQWLTSDSRARWSLLAGVAGIVVGGIIGQAIGLKLERKE